MRAARRQVGTTVISRDIDDPNMAALAGLLNSRLPATASPDAAKSMDTLAERVGEVLASHPNTSGMFAPTRNTANVVGLVAYKDRGIPGIPASDPRPTRRHELMHAYNEAARRGHQNLPLASRAVGWLGDNNANTWRGAAGMILDESVATRVGGRPLLDVPWDVYAQQFRKGGLTKAAALADGLHGAQRATKFVGDHPTAISAAAGTGIGLGYALAPPSDTKKK